MFESIINFFKKIGKQEKEQVKSKDAAKERLHLVLMQDRANVSADFLDLMKQEIIEVIKKYICVDENAIDVRLTNKANEDGTSGAPALYANIPIVSIKQDVRSGMARQKDSKEKEGKRQDDKTEKSEEKDKQEEINQEEQDDKEKENKLEEKQDNSEQIQNEVPEEIVEQKNQTNTDEVQSEETAKN